MGKYSGTIMKKCVECKWKYPEHLLSPIAMNDGYTGEVCGICALHLINIAHGVNRKNFTGEMAEYNRLNAIEWRKEHPDLTPLS